MNRRSFFETVGTVAGSFLILPSATTYQRIWREVAKTPNWVVNPDYTIRTIATMEVGYYEGDRGIYPILFDNKTNKIKSGKLVKCPYPFRFNEKGEYIPPMVNAELIQS